MTMNELTYMEDVNRATSECIDCINVHLDYTYGVRLSTEQEDAIWDVIQDQLSNYCVAGDYRGYN